MKLASEKNHSITVQGDKLNLIVRVYCEKNNGLLDLKVTVTEQIDLNGLKISTNEKETLIPSFDPNKDGKKITACTTKMFTQIGQDHIDSKKAMNRFFDHDSDIEANIASMLFQ